MGEKRKILLVDDEAETLSLLSNTLKRHNYEVIATAKAKEAVRLVQKTKPDLVILDIFMPDKDGGDIAAELAADSSTRDIPVIFLTALLEKREVPLGVKAGKTYEVVAKPVNEDEILAAIKRSFSQ